MRALNIAAMRLHQMAVESRAAVEQCGSGHRLLDLAAVTGRGPREEPELVQRRVSRAHDVHELRQDR